MISFLLTPIPIKPINIIAFLAVDLVFTIFYCNKKDEKNGKM